jgi:hypothetical protein
MKEDMETLSEENRKKIQTRIRKKDLSQIIEVAENAMNAELVDQLISPAIILIPSSKLCGS